MKRAGDAPVRPRFREVLKLGFILLAAGLFAGCTGQEAPVEDAVVEVSYQAMPGGRSAWSGKDVEKTWYNAMGYAFAARRPQGEEHGIAALQVKQDGAAIRGEFRGVRKTWSGSCALAEGYWIVDVFTPLNTYLVSAVAREDMADRRLLHHLGISRKVADDVDRFSMLREEQLYWRTFLPIVLANEGLVWMYGRARPSPRAGDTTAVHSQDGLMFKRYRVERIGEYILVGEDRTGASYRHIFTAGENYLASFVQYRPSPLPSQEVLAALGLGRPDSSGARAPEP